MNSYKHFTINNHFWREAVVHLLESSTPIVLPHYCVMDDMVYTVRGRPVVNLSKCEIDVLKNCANGKIATSEELTPLFEKRLITFVPHEIIAPMQGSESILVLSPHIDDAALGIGALINDLVNNGKRVDVLNIYSKQTYQTGIRVPDDSIDRYSIKEEEVASRCLGYSFTNVGMLGAADRTNLSIHEFVSNCNKLETIHLAHKSEIEVVSNVIKDFFRKGKYSSLFCPMAIGQHLDHVIVLSATAQLIDNCVLKKSAVFLYEDQPYAAADMKAVAMPRIIGEIEKVTYNVSECAFAKLSALMAYGMRLRKEQILSVFAYAKKQVLHQLFCENLWKLN